MAYRSVQVFSGRRLDLISPKPDGICIEDIAHSLSLQCRYNGHCKRFYGVADHSIRMVWALPDKFAPWALLHDSAEAYVSDMVRPLKRLLPGFRKIEDRILRVIAEKFELEWPMPEEIHTIDTRLLMSERRDLMGPKSMRWKIEVEPLPGLIVPMSPEEAERIFLAIAEAVL